MNKTQYVALMHIF